MNMELKVEVGEVMEMAGYSLTDRANRMLERGRNEEVAKKLYTVGREMIEEGREEGAELIDSPEEKEIFKDSLYRVVHDS